MRRHDFLRIDPRAWRALIKTQGNLAADPLILCWADMGWPVVGRTAYHDEASRVPVSLPLPPSLGKRRLAFTVARHHIRSMTPPPVLSGVRPVAPRAWWPTLDRIGLLASTHSLKARFFGSLAWQAVTGLNYLTETSDLDVLFYFNRDTDLPALTAGLDDIDARAPMRIDGEFVRSDGAAVNWRALRADNEEVLVKTLDGVAFLKTKSFALGGTVS